MRYELYKILDKRFAEDLLNGNLYMNTLDYFRKVEGNSAQGDPIEGVCGTIRKNQLRQMGFHYDPVLVEQMGEKVILLSDNYGFGNIFCLYRLQIDDDRKLIYKPDEKLRNFNDKEVETKVVIRIKDTGTFLHRVDIALQKALEENTIEYGIYGGVEYKSAWLNADGPGERSSFHKEPSYAYQKEWRLCLLRYVWGKDAFSLPVGDLHDIAEEISLDTFISHPEINYPGYKLAEDIPEQNAEAYHIFGGINAVSHLMYAYMPHPLERLTMSDQAKADWHYTQFLNLSDRQGEIDGYLESCLEKCKDMEHMELLAQYRLSKGEWVRATDAFYYIIENAQKEIERAPERFFFQLHTILMQHQEAADAGKFLKIAISNYKLPDDMVLIMQSDCLFALGFYDRAAEVFKHMQENSNDPIIEYCLAVCECYLLHFDKANEHLHIFKKYFSNSTDYAQKVARLQKLIDCFLFHQPYLEITKEHALSGLAWNNKMEGVLATANGKDLYLGIDALYQIEIAHKWDLISLVNSVDICPMTIARILELYEQTGDFIFYQLVMHLTEQKNITVHSPELDYYLAIDADNRDLLPHYKMELAFLKQNQMEKGKKS